jgi:threonine dehydrogenase-like Zn-dependent dehydrogenase
MTFMVRAGAAAAAGPGSSAPVEVLFTAPDTVSVRPIEDERVGDREVKIQTVLAGISHGTELNILRGTAPGFRRRWNERLRLFDGGRPRKQFPVAPGYECVGRIVTAGRGVNDLDRDRLIWIDRPHRTSHVVPQREARAGLLSESMTPERGIFCALARVALGAIHDGGIRIGDRVAIVGLGAIGLLAVQLARLNGAAAVFALDREPRRLAMAEQLGAVPIDTSGGGVRELKRRTRRPGVDVALETSGRYEGLQTAIASAAVAGRVVIVSSYQGGAGALSLGEEFHRNRIDLIASMTVNGAPHRAAPHWDLRRLNETARHLLAEGALETDPLITHVFPLGDAPRAYALLRDRPGECIRIALRP